MCNSQFQVRGIIEGFYGVYYTFPERNDLIRFAAKHGYNLYIYGPKNDRQHRARWWEPYPEYIMEKFKTTVEIAKQYGVTFCYAIGSGVSMSYASNEDFEKITTKLNAFYNCGVRAFSITLDDLASEFKHTADKERYKSFAEAHADVCNRLYNWLKTLDDSCTLSMCPTDYHGIAPFSDYIHELGTKLNPEIDIFYTGMEICSPEILTSHAEGFSQAVKRLPIIWDNYPVNDLAMQPEMHIGPIQRRESTLANAVKGIAVNTMIQAEVSKIPLLTYADYMKDPQGYDHEHAWKQALLEVGGKESFDSLLLFAENSLYSCLSTNEAEKLEGLAAAALAVIKNDDCDSHAVDELENYLTSVDEACYYIKNRMENLALRNNLLPWIELMENWHWMTKRAIMVIRAIIKEESYEQPLNWMKESLEVIKKHPKRIGGNILLPITEYALEMAIKKSGKGE